MVKVIRTSKGFLGDCRKVRSILWDIIDSEESTRTEKILAKETLTDGDINFSSSTISKNYNRHSFGIATVDYVFNNCLSESIEYFGKIRDKYWGEI